MSLHSFENKPFCVGTQGENGFSGREETDGFRPDISFLETYFEFLDKIGAHSRTASSSSF
jgi:CDGSH-type Zn-finger protein